MLIAVEFADLLTAEPVSIMAMNIGLDNFDVILKCGDGFCCKFLESPPSRVPASRKPADNHVFGDRAVYI
ncbi:unnamed protein product [Rotaria magnacalcarata]|uniref:Uncharacterized protein n=1 Tax=Rotaria magnacalcarata TaxID=392030 RepID=A0A820M025_9BILA|nr:unnamed protein product [Rotaria magnacalcarata]